MIRRFSAALIGLALCLPIFAIAPVAAHTNGGLVVSDVTQYTDAEGTHVAGTVTNHTSARRANITVTATWDLTVDESQSAGAFINNLAPHAVTSFHILETVDVSADPDDMPVVTAAGTITGTKPTVGIEIVSVGAVTGDSVTVTLHNDSLTTGLTGVVVSALRSGAAANGAAQSAPADIAANATVPFTINFDAESDGTLISAVAARSTTGGTLGTTWNNFFGDLGTTGFKTEIEFLADEGITLGCGNSNFCPTAPVTREAMALFLVRAEVPSDPTPFGFTDISTLTQASQDAINSLANAGVTTGCSAVPLKYCPANNVKRGEMSKFIVLAYSLPDATGSFIDSFTDDDGHFSEPFNDSMKQAGITGGCGATTYCPNSNVLREQMARFLFNAEN